MPQSLVDFDQFDTPTAKQRQERATASRAETAAAAAPALTAAQIRAADLNAQETEAKLEERKAKAAAAEAAKKEKERAAATKATADREQALLLLKFIQDAKDQVSRTGSTGPLAQVTGGVFSSPAIDLEAALKPIKADVLLDAMAQARIGSAVGATGFGALDKAEKATLESLRGSLSGTQSADKLLETLEGIDRITRVALAREAGYDPYSPEGAALFGLPMPEGAEELPPPSAGDITTGRWEKRPELAGLDAAVTSMIKAGRTAEQIKQYLNEFQPGLGDRADNIQTNIDYWKKTGKDPNVTIERYFVQEQPGLKEALVDNPFGAGARAAMDEASAGVAGFIPGETGQQIRIVGRGLDEKYPTATGIGRVLGGIAGSVGLAKYGLKLPGLLEGVTQETIRGAAQAEPGDRFWGGVEGGSTAFGLNLLSRPLAALGGTLLRGATPDAQTLAGKYGVKLTPGQLTGVDEKTAAGLPIVGGQMQARRNESLLDYNRATFNEVLRPIGATVDDVGQKGVAKAQEAVSAAYDAALGGRAFQLDTPFLQTVRGAPYASLRSMKGDQGPKAAAEIDRILSEISQNGVVDGRAWQQARRQLVDIQNAGEIKDAIGKEAILNNVGDVIDAFDSLVQRQAPDVFEDYMSANTAYRNLKVVERAVDYAKDGDIFGPGNLRAATRQSTNKFGGSAASARGDRPLNELVMAGLNVVPSRMDEVGLAGRLFPVGAGAGAGLGTMNALSSPDEEGKKGGEEPSVLPPELLAIALGAAGASLPYSRGATGLMNTFMGGQRSKNQQLLGDLLTKYSPAAIRGGLMASDNERGVPMPQEPVSDDLIITPEMREAVLGAPARKEEIETFEEAEEPAVEGGGVSKMEMDGREITRDPVSGKMVFVDTGEEVPGYKRGGPVDKADWRGRARSVGQGVAFGFGDEIEGGVRALGRTLTEGDLMALKARYLLERDAVRRQQQAYEAANPYESLAYEGGGAMLTGLIPGAQGATAAKLARLAARYPVRSGLARAGVEGAVYGAGSADSVRDIPRSVAEEAAFGAGMYGAADLAARGVKKGYRRVRGRK